MIIKITEATKIQVDFDGSYNIDDTNNRQVSSSLVSLTISMTVIGDINEVIRVLFKVYSIEKCKQIHIGFNGIKYDNIDIDSTKWNARVKDITLVKVKCHLININARSSSIHFGDGDTCEINTITGICREFDLYISKLPGNQINVEIKTQILNLGVDNSSELTINVTNSIIKTMVLVAERHLITELNISNSFLSQLELHSNIDALLINISESKSKTAISTSKRSVINQLIINGDGRDILMLEDNTVSRLYYYDVPSLSPAILDNMVVEPVTSPHKNKIRTLLTRYNSKTMFPITLKLVKRHVDKNIPISIANAVSAIKISTKEIVSDVIKLINFNPRDSVAPYLLALINDLYHEGISDDFIEQRRENINHVFTYDVVDDEISKWGILSPKHKDFFDYLIGKKIYPPNVVVINKKESIINYSSILNIIDGGLYYITIREDKTIDGFELMANDIQYHIFNRNKASSIFISNVLNNHYTQDEISCIIDRVNNKLIYESLEDIFGKSKVDEVLNKLKRDDFFISAVLLNGYNSKLIDEAVDLLYNRDTILFRGIDGMNEFNKMINKLSGNNIHKFLVSTIVSTMSQTTEYLSVVLDEFIKNKTYLSEYFFEFKFVENVVKIVSSSYRHLEEISKTDNQYIQKLFNLNFTHESIHNFNSYIVNQMLMIERKKIKNNVLFNKIKRTENNVYIDTVNEVKSSYNKSSEEYIILKKFEILTNTGILTEKELAQLDNEWVNNIENNTTRNKLANADKLTDYINSHNNKLALYARRGIVSSLYKNRKANTIYLDLLKDYDDKASGSCEIIYTYMRNNKINELAYEEAIEILRNIDLNEVSSLSIFKIITSMANLISEEVNTKITTQSLIPNQQVYRLNLKSTRLIAKYINKWTSDSIDHYMQRSNHPVNNKFLTISWVRFNIDEDNKSIWVNEIQTDMTKILGFTGSEISNALNDKIAYNSLYSFQFWVKKHYPEYTVILPSYTTRKELLQGSPTINGYDNPAKKLKFTKGEYSDTPWNNVKKGKGLVWIWSPLTESKQDK